MEALNVVQEKLQTDPLNIALHEEDKVKYEKYMHTSYMVESFLHQQSKAKWLKMGDDCTTYLFVVIKHKRLQQALTQVKDDKSEWQYNQNVIATKILRLNYSRVN
ncbi:hypothetical protein KY290_033578 [Solanum tuberosum]|uniref:Uncharacterized protein n=1 Tax=Solanum tuberosum TaxID=4113 RepID=A0ABQ7U185_SOLTU|nr:hypothetical protein KY289_032950 [Solanum tuberosum]KAH0647587.1 hypothetical protein KY285_032835 [Solanum tuberosum]KAH0740535.1 hypothetical protein KY290_033578 [Solanum tuberosum]